MKTSRLYHIGLYRGTDNDGILLARLPRKRQVPETLIVQLEQCIDNLSCELWRYWGESQTTKVAFRKSKDEFMQRVNLHCVTNFIYVVVI